MCFSVLVKFSVLTVKRESGKKLLKQKKHIIWVTLLLADSYMSPSTLRAYATRFSIRRSFSAAGSGVGNMACTLMRGKQEKWKTHLPPDAPRSTLLSDDRTWIFIMFQCQTYSLCTRWVRRSWVTCSCQAFLTPVAERGAAVGRFPMPPATDPSGISWLWCTGRRKKFLKFTFKGSTNNSVDIYLN